MNAQSRDRSALHKSSLEMSDRAVRRLDISELLGDAQEIVIVHNGEDYRLRITSRGRLILTK